MSSAREGSPTTDAAELRHGLRTPLNHIIGYTEMLYEDAVEMDAADVAASLGEVLTEAQHVCDLIQKHPVFSKQVIGHKDLEELRAQIFEPVHRLRTAVSDLSGLPVPNAETDLARINKAVAELIEFSQSGKRPANIPAAVHENSRQLALSPGYGQLLVVDDDEANRDVLRRQLERQGYTVEEAASGSEALTELRQRPFDAVLLDLVMPEMSGLEVLKEMKRDTALHEVPVLVISASDDLASVAESIKRGAEDYLLKPFDPVLLRARLSATLDRKRYRDQERTRSRELEQVTRALQRSNEDLQRFAYAASHDLQAPIRTINSYLQLLERRLGERLNGEEQELISIAKGAAKRMSTLIQDLLLYSQVSTSPRALEPVDCEALLAALVSDLNVAVEESQAIIAWDSLPTVHVERTAMRQLLQNLVGNAMKYRAARPVQVRITASFHDGFWLFCVKDNGLGIPSEYKVRIFEMFHRLHGEELPGSGIGLAMCQRIVERFGGKIWVESTLGEGSEFYFTIPATSTNPEI
jgi:light-regulated signal transduction histidine kinase (bacteriophytochrome)